MDDCKWTGSCRISFKTNMNIRLSIPKPNLETVKKINDLYLTTWLHTYPNKEKNITVR